MEITKVDLQGLEPGGPGWDHVMPELFALPVETKQRNVCDDVMYGGYIGQIPGLSYETLCIQRLRQSLLAAGQPLLLVRLAYDSGEMDLLMYYSLCRLII
jgi:hypothetical protein